MALFIERRLLDSGFHSAQIPLFVSVFMLSRFGRNSWDVIVFLLYLVPPKHIRRILMETGYYCAKSAWTDAVSKHFAKETATASHFD